MPKLKNDYSDSIVQLSDEQFEDLERQNGRIVDFPMCYHVLTAGQVEELDSDDWSYYHELLEEERCLRAEFGL
jgi:hypothetical protein